MSKYLLILLLLSIVSCGEKHNEAKNNPLIGLWAIHSSNDNGIYICSDSVDKSVKSMMDHFISKEERNRLGYEDSLGYVNAFLQYLNLQQSIKIVFTDSTMKASGTLPETNITFDTVQSYKWLSDKSIQIANKIHV